MSLFGDTVLVGNPHADFAKRLKQEDEAWIGVGTSYNSFRSSVLGELEERKREFPSAKVKGKRRATAEDIALWDISEKDLPEHFRGKEGLGLARTLVEPNAEDMGALRERMDELEYTVRCVVVLACNCDLTAVHHVGRSRPLPYTIGTAVHTSSRDRPRSTVRRVEPIHPLPRGFGTAL